MSSQTSRRMLLAAALLPALLLASCRSADPSGPGGGSGSLTSLFPQEEDTVLLMTADKTAARPGEDVTYTIIVRNTAAIPLTDPEVDVTLPLQKLTVKDAPGGTATDTRISWTAATLAPGEETAMTYVAAFDPQLAEGDLVRTAVSLRSQSLGTPVTAATEVRVGETVANASAVPASSAAVAGTVASASSSSANAGYDFFIGAADTSSGTPQASGALALTLQSDQAEHQPGDRVRYTLSVRNTSSRQLANVVVQATFSEQSLSVTDAGGGTVQGNTVAWSIPSLDAGRVRTITFGAALSTALQKGAIVTTVAEASAVSVAPLVATADIHILSRLPEAGAEERFYKPVEDTTRFLRPLN
ncbi:MAG: hypothetical protein PHW10_06045 [Candidatus Peribacteraceae bacterium]|nr:hypothetical protein [Candidatus Peribacteraceae bacterium]